MTRLETGIPNILGSIRSRVKLFDCSHGSITIPEPTLPTVRWALVDFSRVNRSWREANQSTEFVDLHLQSPHTLSL